MTLVRWSAGDVLDVASSSTPRPMIESGPVYLICGTDITKRKRHEAEVRANLAQDRRSGGRRP